MAYTHTIFPGYVPTGYFDVDNIEFLREKIAEVLQRTYTQKINFDKASVVRIMQRVLDERLEPIPKMNQRVIMYCVSEYLNHQQEIHRNLKWEEHYIESQRLYDPTVERGPDMGNIKLANRLGKPRVGGTMRFVFF
ncbi:MAG TPA: hypothetical protein PKD85_08980 [Saprospiraceae bacterium]|nr:hypothetical protein [Saprospiraceae bacterium]